MGLLAVLLRAVERRRVRALHRANRLSPISLDRSATAEEHVERDHLQRVHDDYERAYNALHTALVFVNSAAELLRKLGRDGR